MLVQVPPLWVGFVDRGPVAYREGKPQEWSVLRSWLAIAMLALLLCGCATTSPEALAANDRFEPTNRKVFRLNQKLDKYVVVPTVGVYILLVPEWGRTRVHDLLDNLSLPITFANDLLQGELKRGGETF